MPKKAKKKSAQVSSVARKVSKAKPKKKKKSVAKKGSFITAGDVGHIIGGMIAPGVGGKIGRAVGHGASMLFGSIRGSGDYTVSRNSLVGVTNVPSFGENTIRVRAREYINDVNGSTTFLNRTFPINPGNSTMFPWLSGLATKYQQYELHGLIFEFVSTSSNALSSTNTALGKVVMATSYNVGEPPFPDVKSALITQFSNMGKPADNLIHAIECKRGSAVLDDLYVRSETALVEDPKFYDFGNFQLITDGMQAASDIGGLWVSYDISLSKPTLALTAATIPSTSWTLPGMSGGMFFATTPTPPTPDVGLSPFAVTSTQSAIAVEFPQIGDKYMFLMESGGPTFSGTGFTYLFDGIELSDYYPIRTFPGNAQSSNISWIRAVFTVTANAPSTLPFVGISFLHTAFPNGWTGRLLTMRLNSGCALDPAPSSLGMSKIDRYRHFLSAMQRCERKESVDERPESADVAPYAGSAMALSSPSKPDLSWHGKPKPKG